MNETEASDRFMMMAEKALRQRDELVKVLEKIEYASRKDSMTDRERLQSVRTVVCAALSRFGSVVGSPKTRNQETPR